MNAAAIAPQEASKRRRLVYASCQGVLSEKDSLTMVALCDNQFSQVETFTPFRFFKEAQTRFNLSAALVKTLLQRFTESQKISIEQLADPMPSSTGGMTAMTPLTGAGPLAGTASAVGYEDGTRSAEQVVFEHFVGKLFAYLQTEQQPKIKNYLGGIFTAGKMTPIAKTLLMQTLQNGSFMPQVQKLNSPDMISVLDVLYSCYCELYGPVQADRIFASITSEVETGVPEARQFSPRQFL